MSPPLTIAQFLQKHRGELVELKLESGMVSGHVFSVENRVLDEQPVESVTLLMESGLQAFAIPDVANLKFQREQLQTELRMAMQGIDDQQEAETKRLVLNFKGGGQRQVRFAYVVDWPIWRMTYRLDIQEESSTFQGWAHIDNVTGDDWENVEVELLHGQARTFHAPLFEPILSKRRSLGLSVFRIPSGLDVFSLSLIHI